jgi:DnaJ-class molecular chaperone
MAYSSNNGCGCILTFFVIAVIVGGIRSCASGDIKMPNFGSSRVSGGSGSYGTSNGYNVNYKNTTSPNYNSSTNDYEYTNSSPTDYREGKSNSSFRSNPQPSKMGQPHQYNSMQYNSIPKVESSKPKHVVLREKCTWCHGTGKRKVYDQHFSNPDFPSKCLFCGRTDSHTHEKEITCDKCDGKGNLEYELCSHCNGEGFSSDAFHPQKEKCIYCSGTGKTIKIHNKYIY